MRKLLVVIILLLQFQSIAQNNNLWQKAQVKDDNFVHNESNLSYNIKYDDNSINILRFENGIRVKTKTYKYSKLVRNNRIHQINPIVLIEGDENSLFLIIKSFYDDINDENYYLLHFDRELKLVCKPKLLCETSPKIEGSFFGLTSKAFSKNYLALSFFKNENGNTNTFVSFINRKTGEDVKNSIETMNFLHLTDEGTLYSIGDNDNKAIRVTSITGEEDDIFLPELGQDNFYKSYNILKAEDENLVLSGTYSDSKNILTGFFNSRINVSLKKIVDFSKMELDKNSGQIKSYFNDSDKMNQSFIKMQNFKDNLNSNSLFSLRGIIDIENGEKAMIYEENKGNAFIPLNNKNSRFEKRLIGIGINRIYIIYIKDKSIYRINYFNFMSQGNNLNSPKIKSIDYFKYFIVDNKIHFIFNEFLDYYKEGNLFNAIGYENIDFQSETAVELTVHLYSGKEISRTQIYTEPNTCNYIDLNLINYDKESNKVTYFLTVFDLKTRRKYYKKTFEFK